MAGFHINPRDDVKTARRDAFEPRKRRAKAKKAMQALNDVSKDVVSVSVTYHPSRFSKGVRS